MIAQCNCKHAVQDELHGKGMRVHTEDNKKQIHCTVCGPKSRWEQRLDLHAKEHVKQAHG